MAKIKTSIKTPRHPSDPTNADQEIADIVATITFEDNWKHEYDDRGEALRHILARVHPRRFQGDTENGWEISGKEYNRKWERNIDLLSHIQADSVAGIALKLRLLEQFFEDTNWCERLVDVLRSALDDAERLARA